MRTRVTALSAGLVLIVLLLALAGMQPQALANLQTDGTPAATPADDGTPVATEDEPTEEAADSGIVTMVLWYQQNESGEILLLTPISSTDGVLAVRGRAEGDSQRGRVVFDESRNEGFPRIRVGDDNYFDAYPVYPDDPTTAQRWIFFDDDPVIRPATLVMQITGIRGEYEDWDGTATYVSRGVDQGGILVIAIRPPEQ